MTSSASRDLLNDQVRKLLNSVLLQAGFPGREQLLRQAANVNVVGGPITRLDLQVSEATPASAFTDGPVPASMEVFDATGAPVGELLIWVEGGYLTMLELSWWTDDPPDRLPVPDYVRVGLK